MEHPSLTEAEDPRKRELKLDVLRDMLSQEYLYSIDVGAELTRLRREDPLTHEVIRQLAEKSYPGREDMFHKEKTVRILLAAFRIRGRMDETDFQEFLHAIDELTQPPGEPSVDDVLG